jgi:DNA primase catalytic core
MITNLSELVETIDRIPVSQYLEKIGVEVTKNKKVVCVNPDHDDHNPSMHVYDDRGYVKCFSCGFYGSSLNVHAIRTGRQLAGDEFVDVAKEVADLFAIDYNFGKPSPEEIERQKYFQVYHEVSSSITKITDTAHPDLYKYIAERSWNADKLLEMGVGYVEIGDGLTVLDKLREERPDQGFGIYDTSMFADPQNKLVTTFYDEKGRTVGFAARKITWQKGDKDKWVNTSGIVPIFDKSNLLYNHKIAKQAIKAGADTLYIFEGQSSAITCYHNGLKATVAAGGSSLTPGQARLLKNLNPSKYVLCFDPDDAGIKCSINAIREHASTLGGHKLYVKDLRVNGDLDPDEFIRANDIEVFKAVENVPAFDWLFGELTRENGSREVMLDLIKLISSFHSPLEREDLARSLSMKTGYSFNTITEEIDNIVNEKELTQKQKVKDLTDQAMLDIRKNPTSAISVLDGLRTRIESIQADTNTSVSSGDFYMQEMLRFQDEAEAFEAVFPGFQMPLMPGFASAFNNDWSRGRMICIGGEENAGKSSFSSFTCYNLALPEADNNLHVLYMTIDDSVPELFPKFVAMAGRHRTRGYRGYEDGFPLEINHIVRPKYWGKILRDIDPQLEQDMLYAYKVGYQEIMKMAREERLVLFGIPHAQNLEDFERAIASFRKKYPSDNIFAYLDNIHKLPLGNADARLAFKDISNRVKMASVRHNIAIGGTLEYNSDSNKRQKDQRPTNSSLAESRAFRYDASAIVHVYNHKHVFGDKSNWYHETKSVSRPGVVQKFPVIEAIIGKNKISGDKDTHCFLFHPTSSWFEEVDTYEIAQVVNARDQADDKNNKDYAKKEDVDVWALEDDNA